MAPNRGRNRAVDFDDLLEGGQKELDPEEDVAPDSDNDNDEQEDDTRGREHYGDVVKSKLRSPKDVILGPQYHGAQIRRGALLADDEEDNPFSRGFADEDEDEDSDASEFSNDGDDVDVPDADGTSDTDLSAQEDALEPVARRKVEDRDTQAQLRQIVNGESRRSVAVSLSQANKDDAEKGRSVKRQRTTFDSLLSTRMKLQKSLIATNTIVGLETEQSCSTDGAKEAVEAAEKAAFQLWSSLNSFKEDLLDSRTKEKRKRTAFSINTPSEDLVAHFDAQENEMRPHRNGVLEKWSRKAQGPSVRPEKSRLNQDRRAAIVDILQEQLSNTERLVKKTHAPRSCAPLQSAKHIVEDDKIYDDADFYGLLLKELLEQKSQDSVAASSIDVDFQMRRENKTKRNVDTKASKGRKMRFTVQEKLQNFMAPEDRSTWGERQADELFGSLFGQTMGLGEKEEDHEMMEDEVDPEEAGLMMFRS